MLYFLRKILAFKSVIMNEKGTIKAPNLFLERQHCLVGSIFKSQTVLYVLFLTLPMTFCLPWAIQRAFFFPSVKWGQLHQLFKMKGFIMSTILYKN